MKIKPKRQKFEGKHTAFYYGPFLEGKVKIVVSNLDDNGDGDTGTQSFEVHGEDILAFVLHVLKSLAVNAAIDFLNECESFDVMTWFRRAHGK